jgi:hypothetical protein
MTYTIWGGSLRPPVEVNIVGELPVSAEDVFRNVRHTQSLGLKSYREAKATGPRLAVVGGGLSINEHVASLQAWDGEVWAINGALAWCRDNGIDATFFAVDPDPIVARWAVGAKRAVLEQAVHPTVLQVLQTNGCEIFCFDAGVEAGAVRAAGSAASAVPHVAIRMGFREVTFFGCEGSYQPDRSHAYQNEAREQEMIIEVEGEDFLTAPDFYVYSLALAEYIREVPEFIKEESGGLLRALIKSKGVHRVRWVSEMLARNLSPIRKPAEAA